MIQPYLLESSLTVFIYFTNELFQQILKGFSVKESEISRGLVSPAQRALKKIWKHKNFGPEKAPIRPMPKVGDAVSRLGIFSHCFRYVIVF